MPLLRLGSVSYLNARPLVYGLEHASGVSLRFDVPARCADLLHEGASDLGLVPSIEYLRAPAARGPYAIVPDIAIASLGAVASVALYTTRPIGDVESIALDTSSRTSVALVTVLCRRVFGIAPRMERHGPDIAAMLETADAALVIGDLALLQPGGEMVLKSGRRAVVEKIDLGDAWTGATGLPFVYAFWAGPESGTAAEHVGQLLQTRDAGVAHAGEIGRAYFAAEPEHQTLGADYLRDNIKYSLGPRERAGLELFYQYAAEAGVVEAARPLRFF
jgi:predicted solute-binding protein